MKRTLSFLLLFVAAISVSARLSEKQIRKTIIECDVADTVLHATDTESFWLLLQQTNRHFHKTAKSLASSGDRDIKRRLIAQLSDCDSYFRNVPTRFDLYEIAEQHVNQSGIRAISPTANLTITEEDDVALFGYPNGYIFITDGLYKAIDGNSEILSALFASEAVHYALQHAYAHQKYEQKRRRRHKFWQIFGAVALSSASIVLDQATNGEFPAEIGLTAAAMIATAPVRDRFYMHYTPEQILEADIIAYRYCQIFLGSGKHYIQALAMIGNDIDATTFQNGDVPCVSDRIALLEFMENNPQMRQKVKGRKSLPRPVKNYFNPFSPSNYR